MKRVLCALMLACLSTASVANATLFGRVSLYTDAASTQCILADTEPRLAEVFVVHEIGDFVGNAYLLNFSLTASAGFTGSWVEDNVTEGMSAVGTSQDGIVIHYQACLVGDVPILRVTYQLFGTSSPCSSLQVSAYPGVDFIETMNCSFRGFAVAGGTLVINSNESCPCQSPLAVRTSTWGQVKALYR